MKNQAIKYFVNLIGIDVADEFTLMDIEEEITQIEDLLKFRAFVKQRIYYEKYRFLKPNQKFYAILNDYKNENTPSLDDETLDKVYSFSQKLYSSFTTFADELNFDLQTRGIKLKNVNLKDTFEKYFSEKEMQVLNQIGLLEAYRLAVHNKPKFEEQIENIITRKALVKKYPELENKRKLEGLEDIVR